MLYVIDFSERLAKWKQLPPECQVCLVHENIPEPIALKSTDTVFAHSKHFCSDLTDEGYKDNSEVQQSLSEWSGNNPERVKKGIRNVLALRAALRKAGKVQAPRLVIFSGADLAPKANWMREDVCKISLSGFPKEKVDIAETILPRTISSQDLERYVSGIISLHPSTTSFAATATGIERLWTIYLLCDAWQLNEGSAEKVHAGTRLRAPASPEQWFRPLGKSPCEKAAKEIAAEVPTPEAAATVEAFLKRVAKSRPAAGEVQTIMTTLHTALRSSPAR